MNEFRDKKKELRQKGVKGKEALTLLTSQFPLKFDTEQLPENMKIQMEHIGTHTLNLLHKTYSHNKFNNPIRFDTPEALQQEIISYLEYCTEKVLHPTEQGLKVFLGVSDSYISGLRQQSLYEYVAVFDKFKDVLSDYYQQAGLNGTINPKVFELKMRNSFGWNMNATQTEQSQITNNPVEAITAKIDDIIAEYKER